MGNYPAKVSKVVKAKNYHRRVWTTPASLCLTNTELAAGAVVIFLLLGAIGYSLARYKDYAKKCWVRALLSLETNFKPSCPS